MAKKKPCSKCRRWFEPHPRAGSRQKFCSDPDCQRERHRRGCARWHDGNPDYDRDRRLREKFVLEEPAPEKPAIDRDPGTRLDWSFARDAVGLEVTVIIDETTKVMREWMRDVVRQQPP